MRTLWILGLVAVLGLGAACSHSEEKMEAPAATAPAADTTAGAPALTTPEPAHEAAPTVDEAAKPVKKAKKKKKTQ